MDQGLVALVVLNTTKAESTMSSRRSTHIVGPASRSSRSWTNWSRRHLRTKRGDDARRISNCGGLPARTEACGTETGQMTHTVPEEGKEDCLRPWSSQKIASRPTRVPTVASNNIFATLVGHQKWRSKTHRPKAARNLRGSEININGNTSTDLIKAKRQW